MHPAHKFNRVTGVWLEPATGFLHDHGAGVWVHRLLYGRRKHGARRYVELGQEHAVGGKIDRERKNAHAAQVEEEVDPIDKELSDKDPFWKTVNHRNWQKNNTSQDKGGQGSTLQPPDHRSGHAWHKRDRHNEAKYLVDGEDRYLVPGQLA